MENRATEKQMEYIEILRHECLNTRSEMKSRYGNELTERESLELCLENTFNANDIYGWRQKPDLNTEARERLVQQAADWMIAGMELPELTKENASHVIDLLKANKIVALYGFLTL
jgi:hypothetical protein